MKINTLETHDRLLHFKKTNNDTISQGAEECLKRNPLSLALQDKSDYIYIFAHPRTSEDGVTKRLLWQPRLGKPKSQTNSYLFRSISHSDTLEICWLLPPRELWNQYKKGNVCENELVIWSIDQFENNREVLDAANPNDLSEEKIRNILKIIAYDMECDIKTKRILQLG